MGHILKSTGELFFHIFFSFLKILESLQKKKKKIPSFMLGVRKNQETSSFGKSSDDVNNYLGQGLVACSPQVKPGSNACFCQ